MLSLDQKYLVVKQPDGSLMELKKTIFLKHFITKDFIEVGDYTYYDESDNSSGNPEDFENNNVIYFTISQKLKIGKFCSLASKCKFMMPGAAHHLNSFTTYPLFWNFATGENSKSFFENIPGEEYHYKVYGDTIIGNDVWIGYDALIMPGVKIGDGAVIGSRAVVAKDVPPYTIVVGNPGKVIKQRFDDETIKKLLELKWWNWDMEKIVANYDAIMNRDIEKLMSA